MRSRITFVTLFLTLAVAAPALAHRGRAEERIWFRGKSFGWKSKTANGARRSTNRWLGGPFAGQGLESNAWNEGSGRWSVSRKFGPGGKVTETTVTFKDPAKGIGIDASVRNGVVRLSNVGAKDPEHDRASKRANQYLRTKGSILRLR